MTYLTQPIEQDAPTKPRLIDYYQGFLAVAATLIFYTRLDIYLQNELSFGIPLLWMLGFFALSLPLFLVSLLKLKTIALSIILWILGYLGFAFLAVTIHSKLPPLQYLEDQYRSIIFLMMMLVIFAYRPVATKLFKRTVLVITILNVFTFLYEFFNPLAFYLVQRAAGRSSGVYEDSNTAGIALIVGMIFTMDMIKPKYRLLYSLFIFVGIAPTFSRGTIAGWVIVVGLYMLMNVIPRYQVPLIIIFFVMITSILAAQLNNLGHLKTADGESLFREDTLARVEFIINPFSQKDNSKDSRLSHVEDAWKKFSNSPVIGNGLGSGENAATISIAGKAQRSHNTYLDLMVEFGFLGALIYPALLLASVSSAEGEFKKHSIVFVVFMMLQGIFSHTLMNEFCSLIFYAMAANLAKHSKAEYSKQEKLQFTEIFSRS